MEKLSKFVVIISVAAILLAGCSGNHNDSYRKCRDAGYDAAICKSVQDGKYKSGRGW